MSPHTFSVPIANYVQVDVERLKMIEFLAKMGAKNITVYEYGVSFEFGGKNAEIKPEGGEGYKPPITPLLNFFGYPNGR